VRAAAAAGWCPLACPAPRARTARIDKGNNDAPVHSRGASPLGPQPREGQPAGEGVVLAGGARRRRRYWRRGRARHQGGPTRAYDFPYAYAARCCCSCCCFLPMPAHLLTPIAAATAIYDHATPYCCCRAWAITTTTIRLSVNGLTAYPITAAAMRAPNDTPPAERMPGRPSGGEWMSSFVGAPLHVDPPLASLPRALDPSASHLPLVARCCCSIASAPPRVALCRPAVRCSFRC